MLFEVSEFLLLINLILYRLMEVFFNVACYFACPHLHIIKQIPAWLSGWLACLVRWLTLPTVHISYQFILLLLSVAVISNNVLSLWVHTLRMRNIHNCISRSTGAREGVFSCVVCFAIKCKLLLWHRALCNAVKFSGCINLRRRQWCCKYNI